MEKENHIITDFDLELIADFFRNLPRQGPGSDAQTLRAMSFLPTTDDPIRIADVGCGSGAQTAVLASHLNGTIQAIDLLPEMLEELDRRLLRDGLCGKVTPVQASMEALPFTEEQFDVIWAEGSIYNVGFERGLGLWRPFLKPGGTIAVTDCCFLTAERLDNDFMRENFPDIGTVSEKIAAMERAGYAPEAHFVLPENCWTENYYIPMQAHIPTFERRHGHSDAALRFTERLRREIDHYARYKALYGYVFFLGRKANG